MSDIAHRVRGLIAEQLAQAEPSGTLDGLGADSLDVVELEMALEAEFAVVIPDDALRAASTVDDTIALVERLLAERATAATATTLEAETWTEDPKSDGVLLDADGACVCVVGNPEQAFRARERQRMALIKAAPYGLAFAESFIAWCEQIARLRPDPKTRLPGMEAREREARAFIAMARAEGR